jgi:hypothetical protein
MSPSQQQSLITQMLSQLQQPTDASDVATALGSADSFCSLNPDAPVDGIYAGG